MEQLIRSFTAFDERGNQVVLHEWDPVAEVNARVKTKAESVLAPHVFRTSSGRPVNRIAKGEYQEVKTGAIIRSTASDAP